MQANSLSLTQNKKCKRQSQSLEKNTPVALRMAQYKKAVRSSNSALEDDESASAKSNTNTPTRNITNNTTNNNNEKVIAPHRHRQSQSHGQPLRHYPRQQQQRKQQQQQQQKQQQRRQRPKGRCLVSKARSMSPPRGGQRKALKERIKMYENRVREQSHSPPLIRKSKERKDAVKRFKRLLNARTRAQAAACSREEAAASGREAVSPPTTQSTPRFRVHNRSLSPSPSLDFEFDRSTSNAYQALGKRCKGGGRLCDADAPSGTPLARSEPQAMRERKRRGERDEEDEKDEERVASLRRARSAPMRPRQRRLNMSAPYIRSRDPNGPPCINRMPPDDASPVGSISDLSSPTAPPPPVPLATEDLTSFKSRPSSAADIQLPSMVSPPGSISENLVRTPAYRGGERKVGRYNPLANGLASGAPRSASASPPRRGRHERKQSSMQFPAELSYGMRRRPNNLTMMNAPKASKLLGIPENAEDHLREPPEPSLPEDFAPQSIAVPVDSESSLLSMDQSRAEAPGVISRASSRNTKMATIPQDSEPGVPTSSPNVIQPKVLKILGIPSKQPKVLKILGITSGQPSAEASPQLRSRSVPSKTRRIRLDDDDEGRESETKTARQNSNGRRGSDGGLTSPAFLRIRTNAESAERKTAKNFRYNKNPRIIGKDGQELQSKTDQLPSMTSMTTAFSFGGRTPLTSRTEMFFTPRSNPKVYKPKIRNTRGEPTPTPPPLPAADRPGDWQLVKHIKAMEYEQSQPSKREPMTAPGRARHSKPQWSVSTINDKPVD
uniref:Uncharacterized protein n=2 Tax=Lotharella globosa TaxID=91324 RepID=A0A7S4DPF2_9EUKA